jgi:predicted helicase
LFFAPVNGLPQKSDLSPEDIFGYIYGVLHSPAYRAKFKEFLKSDFPRIPYPKDTAEFARFRDAGRTLRETHLMRDAAPPLSEPTARFPVPGDNVVDSVRFEILTQSHRDSENASVSPSLCASVLKQNGRVWINPTQYFDNVPLAAWEQAIGGYHPAEKWLKDRKGRVLTPDDLRHYQRIILALAKTSEVMEGLNTIGAMDP